MTTDKKWIYHTKLQHSEKFRQWFLSNFKINLKPLQERATNAYDQACNIVLRKMTAKHMWAIYYNVVSKTKTKVKK